MAGSSVIIIGAGLGGLVCGRILSRRGLDVTLLEQCRQAGGALQTFEREGVRFDTGFHSVGGETPGGPLGLLFSSIGLPELPWRRMEPDETIGGGAFLRASTSSKEEEKHVLEPYRKGVWRLEGGGKTLVDALSEGLDIRLGKRVTAIEDHVVTCADGSVFRGDAVVCDLHPRVTMSLVRDHVRPAFIRRLEALPDSPGIFTVYIKLRPGSLPHINHEIFIDDRLMIHFGESDPDGFARSVDLLSFETIGLAGGDRIVMPGSDRASRAEDLIRLATKRLPHLPEAIEKYWTSTPSTWERFTGTPGGSAYGIVKAGPEDYLPPVTPLPWLFLTGQNLGLHGILGTTITAFNTCKSIRL